MRFRMRMKRLSAIVLAAALTVSLLPVTALAADADDSVTVSVMETQEDGWAWELDGSELYIIGSDYVWLEESCIEENDDLLEIADQVETISLSGEIYCMDGTFLRYFTNLQQINMDYMYYGEAAEYGYASDLYYDDDALIFSEWWGEYNEDSGDVESEDGDCSYILWVSPNVESYTVDNKNISDYAFANCSSLTEVWFDDQPVEIADNAFYGRTLTAYYNNENEDWTADRLQDYGGSITWKSFGSSPSYVDAVDTAQEIGSTGTEYTASIEEEGAYAYLSFTPEETAYYNVYTTGEEYDVYAYLYNSNWECMAEDDDSAEWPNASITALLEADTTYYIAIRQADGWDFEAGSCGVVVDEVELSGDCSADNSKVSWALDTDGTLTISGIGAMEDYGSCDDTPWAYMRDYIYNIEIGANITYIGSWAFEECLNLQNVYFDGNDTDVSDYAFGDNGVVLQWDERVVLYGDYTSDLTAVYYDGDELTAGEYSEDEDPNDGDYDYCVYTGSNIAVIYFTYNFLDSTYYPSAGAHMFTFAFGEGEDTVEIDLGKEVSGNQYFDFDESTGTLTMSSDYWVDIWDSYDEWWDYNEEVTNIVLGEYIRYIYAVRLYEDFPNLETVTVEQNDTYGDENYYTQLYIGEDGALYYKEGGIDTWYDDETEQDVEEEWTYVHLIRAQTDDEVFTVTSDVNVLEDYALGAANCPNLTTVVFEGEMPDEFWDNVFYEQEITAYYNTDYDSWTDEDNEYKFQDYGGSVTWVSYTGEYDYGTDEDGSGSGSSGSGSSGSGSNTGSVSGSTGGSSGTAAKASQKITIKKAKLKKTIKAKKLKKKSQTFKLKAKTSGDGKITYKKTKGNKKIKISKTGKVTVKKGLKKGTYKVKVKITAKATAKYKKASVTKTITIKVK